MTDFTDVPPIGLGTWNMTDDEVCARTVAAALDCGYRHVDTAQLYGTERAVGEGIHRADISEDEVLVATKVDPERLGSDDLIESVRESRERLGVERIDCLYVHWPRAAYDPDETIAALDALVAQGLVEGIGLSNFTPDLLDEVRDRTGRIVAHQIECHPLCRQEELRAYARRHDHRLVAYSPLARGDVFGVSVLEEIAAEHDATAAQVSLAWLIERDIVPIPKATGEHVRENYLAQSLSLSPAEIERIDGIERESRLVNPPSAPWN